MAAKIQGLGAHLHQAKFVRVMRESANSANCKFATQLKKVGAKDVRGTVEVLKAALQGKEQGEKIAAIEALGCAAGYGGSNVPAEILTAFPLIAAATKAKNSNIRSAALKTLAKFAPASGVEVSDSIIACEAAEYSKNEILQALSALHACKKDEAATAVSWCASLLNHASSEVCERACFVLGWLGEKGGSMIGNLAITASSHTIPGVRTAAAGALVEIDQQGVVVSDIESALPDKNARDNLVRELKRLGEAGRPLRKLLQRIPQQIQEIVGPHIEAGETFIPTKLQKSILDALDGKALNKQNLANEVCSGEGTRLYRVGGIKELTSLGLVCNKRSVGYYRPDRPPPSAINLPKPKPH